MWQGERAAPATSGAPGRRGGTASRVSWKRALLHGLAPVALIIGGGAVIVATADVADPNRFGEGLGRFAVFAYLAGVGISWLAQSGRRRTAWILGGLLVAAVAALAVATVTLAGRASAPLTAAESAPLQTITVDGQARLVHPALGFSLVHPGPGYAARPGLADTMGLAASDPATQVYAYAEDPARAVLVVLVAKDAGRSRAELEEMIAGLERGITTSAKKQLPSASIQVDRREVTWSGEDRAARVQLRVGELAVLRVHAHAIRRPDRVPFVVALMTVAPDDAALPGVVDSFRAGP